MCTVVILRSPDSPWPLLIAANRDEMAGRPWSPPGRHWPDRLDVVAGRDDLAGGSWLGLNDFGMVAAVLNRLGTLGPEAGKRTRGELVLEALDHADAVDAADALAHLDGRAWRPFNLLVADNRDAFLLTSAGRGPITVQPIPEGVHMLTALDLDDRDSPRIREYLPLFQAAALPEPDSGDWLAWEDLLSSGGSGPDGEEAAAMAFLHPDGFGTVSASLIALPAVGSDSVPVWRFAPGRPGSAPFNSVEI